MTEISAMSSRRYPCLVTDAYSQDEMRLQRERAQKLAEMTVLAHRLDGARRHMLDLLASTPPAANPEEQRVRTMVQATLAQTDRLQERFHHLIVGWRAFVLGSADRPDLTAWKSDEPGSRPAATGGIGHSDRFGATGGTR